MKLQTNNAVAQLVMQAVEDDRKLDKLRDKVASITEREVWNEFNYRDGKLIGLLRTIGFEFKHRQELLKLTKIPQRLIDIFLDAYGHPAFIDKQELRLIKAKPMNIDIVKQCLEVAAEIIDCSVDLSDITVERVNNIYKYAHERAKETLEIMS